MCNLLELIKLSWIPISSFNVRGLFVSRTYKIPVTKVRNNPQKSMFIITILIFPQWHIKGAGLLWCDVTQHCTNGQWEAPKSTIFAVTMIQNCTYLYTAVVQQNNNNNNNNNTSNRACLSWHWSAAQQERGKSSMICSVSLGFLDLYWKYQEQLRILAMNMDSEVCSSFISDN